MWHWNLSGLFPLTILTNFFCFFLFFFFRFTGKSLFEVDQLSSFFVTMGPFSDPSSFSWERKTPFSESVFKNTTCLSGNRRLWLWKCVLCNMPRYFCNLTYLPEFTRRKLKPLLQLVSNSHIKQHGPFAVCEGYWNWEHDAVWEIVVAYKYPK